jgi:rhomboid protease GluP
MLNEPSGGERKPHPLEKDPREAAARARLGNNTNQRAILHIPSVKPYVTYTLLAINIILFVVRALSPGVDSYLFDLGSNFRPAVLLDSEYYRLFTSMFLHQGVYSYLGGWELGGAAHLAFNMYFLYALGMMLERMFGHVRFAIIYLLGGLTGSILSTIMLPNNAASVGASGAIFALLGAELVFLYKHRKLFGAGGRTQIRNLLVMLAINFAFGIATHFGDGGTVVDNYGHLGGLIGGLILAWFIAPLYLPFRHPDKPNELQAEDVNPFKNRTWVVSLYASALIVVVAAATYFVRSGPR